VPQGAVCLNTSAPLTVTMPFTLIRVGQQIARQDGQGDQDQR
jgi:hypothetical protein